MQHTRCCVAANTGRHSISDTVTELQEIASICYSPKELLASTNAQGQERLQEVISRCQHR